MSERVQFNPKRECDCPLLRHGYAGVIFHQSTCPKHGIELLAQSGESIVPGKKYRWIQDEINVVAEVTRVKEEWVFAYWNQDRPDSDQYGLETCIPNCSIVELVELS